MNDNPMEDHPAAFKLFIANGAKVARHKIESEEPYAQISDDARDRALNVLSYALFVPEIWTETWALLLVMIPKMQMAGHCNDWTPYLEKGLKISQLLEDNAGQGELCLAIGRIELIQAEFQSAEAWFLRGQQNFCQIADDAGQGKALNRLARSQLDSQDYVASIDSATAALALLDVHDVERANSHYVIGSIYRAKLEWGQAETHYRKSLYVWQEAGDRRGIVWGLSNLGMVLYRQEDYEEAIVHYTRALKIFEHIYDPESKAQTLNGLAAAYQKIQRVDEAAQLLLDAQKIFRTFGNELGVARTTQNLGLSYSALHKWTLAQRSYKQGVRLWTKLGLTAPLCNTLDGLGNTYLKTENYEKAVEVFQKGLNKLENIVTHPKYESLKKMLTEHLDQAQERL